MKTFSPRLTKPELVMTILLGLFLLLLAARAFFQPLEAAIGFGIPIVDVADLFYVHVKGDRDLASAVVVFALLALRERRALGVFVAAATIEPLLDMSLSIADPRGRVAYAAMVHGSAAIYGVILAALLLRRREP